MPYTKEEQFQCSVFRVCTALLVCAALFMSTALNVTADASSSQCPSTPTNLYSQPASVVEACGYTVIPLDHISPRLDGGSDYTYGTHG